MHAHIWKLQTAPKDNKMKIKIFFCMTVSLTGEDHSLRSLPEHFGIPAFLLIKRIKLCSLFCTLKILSPKPHLYRFFHINKAESTTFFLKKYIS